MSQKALNLNSFLDKRPKLRKMDTRFGMWNIQSSYRVGLLIIVAKEITELNVVAIHVRWDRGDTEPAVIIHFPMENGMSHELGSSFFFSKENHFSS
jgi:hypothetical protein